MKVGIMDHTLPHLLLKMLEKSAILFEYACPVGCKTIGETISTNLLIELVENSRDVAISTKISSPLKGED